MQLRDSSNCQASIRLLREVIQALADEVGPDRDRSPLVAERRESGSARHDSEALFVATAVRASTFASGRRSASRWQIGVGDERATEPDDVRRSPRSRRVGKWWGELAMQTRYAYNANEAWCGRKRPGRSELHSKGTVIATRPKHGRSSFES